MTTYEQQLVCWSDSLSAGRADTVLDDLTGDCSTHDVERFLENAIGERYRLLTEELNLVALAFDDFDGLVGEYLREVPRRTFALHEREQQRFLRWLKDRSLTPQQSDFVTYQESEYACYELARQNRTAHLEFQRVWNHSRRRIEKQSQLTNGVIRVNPVCVWTRLEVATVADDESRSGDVVFLAVGTQVRSLWLTNTQYSAAQYLISHNPTTLTAWKASIPQMNTEGHDTLCRELVEGGLVAIS